MLALIDANAQKIMCRARNPESYTTTATDALNRQHNANSHTVQLLSATT
jgi:hypothetical protein